MMRGRRGLWTFHSEIHFDANLYLPRLIGLRRDLAKSGVTHPAVRPCKLHVIEDIECFEPNFQSGSFPDPQSELLEQRCCEIICSRDPSIREHTRSISDAIRYGSYRDLRVSEILVQVAGACNIKWPRKIWILVSVGWYAHTASTTQEELDRKPIVHAINAIDLPSAEKSLNQAGGMRAEFLTLAQRQLIDEAKLGNLRNAKGGKRSIKAEIVGVPRHRLVTAPPETRNE
jgi:hypothetical protein